MRRVYKYMFVIDDNVRLIVPRGARPLFAEIQGGMPCLWALIDPNESETRELRLRIAGTGHDLHEPSLELGEFDRAPAPCLQYLNSFMMHNGMLVFHVFWE